MKNKFVRIKIIKLLKLFLNGNYRLHQTLSKPQILHFQEKETDSDPM